MFADFNDQNSWAETCLLISYMYWFSLWRCIVWNIPVSQLFIPSGEQPEQRISAHKSKQLIANCIAMFRKYCCYIKHGGIVRNLTILNPWGILLMCPNTTMRVYGSRIYHVLWSKHISLLADVLTPASSRQAVRSSRILRLADCIVALWQRWFIF